MNAPLGGPKSLIALLFTGPHIGVRLRWPRTLHAVTSDGLPVKTWPRGLATSVCGKTSVRLVSAGEGPAPWPPRVKSLPDGITRCAECYVATGRPRPRSAYVKREDQ